MGNWKNRLSGVRRDTYVLWLASRDRRVPWLVKVIAGCVVAYALSPIDLIPDFIPILGVLDDAVIIPLGLALVFKMLPSALLVEFRETATVEMTSGKARWLAVVFIVALWIGSSIAVVLVVGALTA